MPEASVEILPFAVADQAGGVRLENVRQVVRAAEILPLPRAPRFIGGVLDFHGQIVPVVNVRERLGLGKIDIELTDRFIISDAGGLLLALHVESVGTVSTAEIKQASSDSALSIGEGLGVAGVAPLPDGTLLIHDLGRFFTASEREALDSALAERM